MELDEVVRRLREAVQAAGGQSAYARKNSVSSAQVSAVLGGSRTPGPAVLQPLGLETCPTQYREIQRRAA